MSKLGGWIVAVLVFAAAASSEDLPRAAPEDVGLASGRLEVLRRAMQSRVDAGKMAGAVGLVARRGKLVWLEAVGKRDLETGSPMRSDAIFRVYSMTKPVTAVAVLTLLEQGRLNLGDPVARHLPRFERVRVAQGETRSGDAGDLRTLPARRSMTVQDLLRQTSGITSPSFGDGPVERLYREAQIFQADETLGSAVDAIARLPLKYEPGTAWEYGASLDVAARVVEVVSGLSYDAYLARHVFEPVGMKDTGFFVEPMRLGRLAQLYVTDPEQQHALVPAEPRVARAVMQRSKLMRGASGLVSTAEDYARFGMMLLDRGVVQDRRVLGRKTVELMTSDQRGSIPIRDDANLASTMLREFTRGYGYGLGVGVRMSRGVAPWPGSIGEFYWDGAASTLFFVDPEEELVAVFMVQLMDYLRGRELQELFRTLVYAAIDD